MGHTPARRISAVLKHANYCTYGLIRKPLLVSEERPEEEAVRVYEKILDSLTVRSENVACPPEDATSTVPPSVAVLNRGKLRSRCTVASAGFPNASVTLTTTEGEITVFTVVDEGCCVKLNWAADPACTVIVAVCVIPTPLMVAEMV